MLTSIAGNANPLLRRTKMSLKGRKSLPVAENVVSSAVVSSQVPEIHTGPVRGE